MAIVDDNNLLLESEREAYYRLLKLQGHEPIHFLLEITEDQTPVDMNDLTYVIIIRAKATHLKHEISKTYVSRAGSSTWLDEFENDLKSGYFTRAKKE